MRHPFAFFGLGILFAALWSSASVAAKIGVTVMSPLVLFQFRFFLAAAILLVYSYFFEAWRWPSKKEWKQLAIFGFFNVTVYLSLFVLAIKEVAAGIGSLSTSMSPLMMAMIGGIFYGKKTSKLQIFGLVLGLAGVWVAVLPLLSHQLATVKGITFLLISILSYSWAALYYADINWSLTRYAINGWQVLFGAIFLLPFTFLLSEGQVRFSFTAMFSILWLVIPVSIISVNLWLRLLKIDPVKTSFFLFLSPIFGFIFATIILSEPFTIYTLAGLGLVLCGLYLGQRSIIN